MSGAITQQNGNVLYQVFIKDLNTTWRRHANQLRTRIEWVPEPNTNQAPEAPQQTEQLSNDPMPPPRRSTRVRRPRQPWSPSHS